MAKYVKITPTETVDAIQIKRYKRIENFYCTPFPKEYEGQPNIGQNCSFIPAGSWIVNDGTEQLIMSNDEFQQRFRRVQE